MKKEQRRKPIILLTIFMAGAVLNGCMPRAIKDAAMDLYEAKVKDERPDQGEDQEEALDEDDDEALEDDLETEDVKDGSDGGAEDGAAGREELDGAGGAGSDGGAGAGTYARYIKEELEPAYGTGDNTSFSYGYEKIAYTDSDYWFASPMAAQLEDGIVATCQRDLDKDGFDELLMLYTEGSGGSGGGWNNLGLKVYSERDGAVVETGGFRLEDCFSGYNREEYTIGLKDLGNERLIYVYREGSIYTWADGVSPAISLYQYNGDSLKAVYQVGTSGSDGSWWQGWENDLRTFGFALPSGSSWEGIDLTGEPGFEVLAYGECVTNEPKSGQYTDMNGTQQWMLEQGRIEGGIYGPGSDIVKRMNQGMTAYAGGGYAGNSGSTAGGGSSGGGAGSAGGYRAADDDYILPQSSSMYLTRQDLIGLTPEQLRLARNEIYARHGRKFQTQELQDYFNSKSWYVGTIEPKNFREEYLNIYEKENLKLIQSMEDR